MRRVIWMSIVLSVAGCGEAPAPTNNAQVVKPRAKPSSTKPPAPKPAPEIKVPADAFADVPQAFDALLKGIKDNDHKGVYIAETWLSMRGATAIAALDGIAKDSEQSLERRLTACRALGRVGPSAKPALMGILEVEQQQVQLRAMESLSLIKPTSPDIVAKLMELAKGTDVRVRQVAIEGLARIGPSAKEAVPLLLEILNDKQESETLRSEAKKALKDIDPRRGLMGVAK